MPKPVKGAALVVNTKFIPAKIKRKKSRACIDGEKVKLSKICVFEEIYPPARYAWLGKLHATNDAGDKVTFLVRLLSPAPNALIAVRGDDAQVLLDSMIFDLERERAQLTSRTWIAGEIEVEGSMEPYRFVGISLADAPVASVPEDAWPGGSATACIPDVLRPQALEACLARWAYCQKNRVQKDFAGNEDVTSMFGVRGSHVCQPMTIHSSVLARCARALAMYGSDEVCRKIEQVIAMGNENQVELVRKGVAIFRDVFGSSHDDTRFVIRFLAANDAGRYTIASDVLSSEFITAPSHVKKAYEALVSLATELTWTGDEFYRMGWASGGVDDDHDTEAKYSFLLL